jgi:3-polyprenyl-4-hydroxybenzoate decarboxylase
MAGYYKDVREHLKVLEERDKLFRIKKQINKDTQLMPLVRLQFRGLEEKQREAFQFENVIDVKGETIHHAGDGRHAGGIDGNIRSRSQV